MKSFKSVLILLVAGLLLVAGCSNSPLNNPLSYFNDSVSLSSINVVELEKYNILFPSQVCRYKDWYVFDENKNIGDGSVKFLSMDFRKIVSGVGYGDGPYDVFGRFGIEVVGDSLYVKDFNHRKLLTADCMGDSLKLSVRSMNSILGSGSIFVGDNRVLMISSMDSSFIVLSDSTGEKISCIDFPNVENLSQLDWSYKYQMFVNTAVAVSPSCRNFAWGVTYFPIMGFGRICGDSISVDKSYDLAPAKYEILDKYIICDKDQPVNFVAGVGTDKYAVFIYSGCRYEDATVGGRRMLLYTWDGTPYKRVDLDMDVYCIKYDPERNVIFGLAMNPDPVFVEYDMKGIID